MAVYRAWTVSFHPPDAAVHEAEQAVCAVFQVFGMTQLGFEPSLAALLGHAQPNIPLCR